MVDVRALGYLLTCVVFVFSADEFIEGSGEGSGEEPLTTLLPTEPPTIQQFSSNGTSFNLLRASLEDKKCVPKMDVIFLLDTSGSIEQIYQEHIRWTVALVDALPVDREKVRIAAVQYAGFPLTEFALGTYLNAADIRQHLSQIKFQSGVTRTGYALRKADSELFREERGARADATKIIVLFTDGLSIDDPLKPAHQLRDIKGVKIYVVSVGSDGFEPEMNRIAGDKRNVFGPNELSRLRDTLLSDAERAGGCVRSGSSKSVNKNSQPSGKKVEEIGGEKANKNRLQQTILSQTQRNKGGEDQRQQTIRNENAQNIEADQAALELPKATENGLTDEIEDQILTAATKYSLKPEDEDGAHAASSTRNEDREDGPATTQEQTRATSAEELPVPIQRQPASITEPVDLQKVVGTAQETTQVSILEGQSEDKRPSRTDESKEEKQRLAQILDSEQLQRNGSLSSEDRSEAIDSKDEQASDDLTAQSAKHGSSKSVTSESRLNNAQQDIVQSGSDGSKELGDKLIRQKGITKTQQGATFADQKSSNERESGEASLENRAQKSDPNSKTKAVTKSAQVPLKQIKAPKSSESANETAPKRATGKSSPTAQNNRKSRGKGAEKDTKAKQPAGGALSAKKLTPTDTPALQQKAKPIVELRSRAKSLSEEEIDAESNLNNGKTPTKSSSESSVEGQSRKATKKPTEKRSKRPSRIVTPATALPTSVPITISAQSLSTRKRLSFTKTGASGTTQTLSVSTQRATTSRRPTTRPISSTNRRDGEGSCPLDILFIVDSSGSVQSIYDKQKEYLTSILSELQIGEQRVALLQFAGGSHQKTEWAFDTFADSDAVMHAFTQVRHFTGTTFIGRALEASLGLLESRRRTVPTIVVLISDGFSQDDATDQAEEIRRLPNLEFYAVSVSELSNSEYMEQLTDDPSKVYVGQRSEELKQSLLKKLHCRG